MPLDQNFLRKVGPLYSAEMGTELISPLLYSLLRMTRSRTVLEIGAGYTTPFILRALKDNDTDEKKEIAQIKRLIKARDTETEMNIVPEYYSSHLRKPSLFSIDSLTHSGTTAHRVKMMAKKAGLNPYLRMINADFKNCSKKLRKAVRSFDFIWFDCGGYDDYVDFLKIYWSLINPKGGFLLLHSTLTNRAIRKIHDQLKKRQKREFNNFELLSILEPHKLIQNSVTLIRITSKFTAPIYTEWP